ncbi:golgin-45-like isoform X2 [Acropora millepora]|uniref:golgin-45-like isoform X2 n=1 Tax=Acropora millepora TaxID=45264 RepID=UPI001CF12BF1|nr:golgin-45-like isoform X2 [Acropora millepora]
MAKLSEPIPLEMERLSVPKQNKDIDHFQVDYSKLPRSSGDGMEFAASSSSDGNISDSSSDSEVLLRKNNSVDGTTVRQKHNGQHTIIHTSMETRTSSQPESKRGVHNSTLTRDLQVQQGTKKLCVDGMQTKSGQRSNQVVQQNTTNPLLQGSDFLNNLGRLSMPVEKQLVTIALPSSDLNLKGHFAQKSIVVEHKPEFVDSQKVINELEGQNSKLVQEKTKLSLQLGVQTKVNAEIKRLLVASVGEDIGNKMMSDELSSWKTALYTRFRQAQTALQKLLDERAHLLQFLVRTKRTIQSLQSVLRKASGRIQDFGSGSSNSNEQSIVEMASVNSSLVEETLKLAGSVLPAFSFSEMSFMVNHQSGENLAELKMQPTSAEKLAFEVLSSDVNLQTEQQMQDVMKRMSKQYIGHGYQSRFSTKNFRVTYDCCNRCSGPLYVV